MSHTVTVTRTTTSATSTAIILNTGILKTASGILKLFETLIGAICLGLVGYYNTHPNQQRINGFIGDEEHTLFLLVTFAFLVTTFLLLISALGSLMAASIIPKTIFEFLYHLFAFIFYISASLSLIVVVSDYNKRYRTRDYEGKMAAGVLGLVNSVLYLLSTIFSFRSYRMG